MTRITPTVFTSPLALGLLSLVALSPTTVTGNTNIATTALSSQAQGLPREFNEHFYDVPLAVHVDLDGRGLGEALITLDRQ